MKAHLTPKHIESKSGGRAHGAPNIAHSDRMFCAGLSEPQLFDVYHAEDTQYA